ncbi:hypothetical protein C0V85_00020 [Salmonella enterica subsp. enterica serovar Hadar]|nr:hypothetical protein C0V85_00020 [Salmonella enterica subsp. enterica serovar Hadar]
MPFTTVFCIFRNVGLRETINHAADALQKSQNGGDIPDRGYSHRISVRRWRSVAGLVSVATVIRGLQRSLSPGLSRRAHLITRTGYAVGVGLML